MLANICLRPAPGEESYQVINDLENLKIDYDLDLSRGLVIFKSFSDWGRYINHSLEVKSRIGDMKILWEGGTVTSSHLIYPSPQTPLQVISTKGNCKFSLIDLSLILSNGDTIKWYEIKQALEKKHFGKLESGKFILYFSAFMSLINLGIIRKHFPRELHGSPISAYIETFYNLKYLVQLPYEIWKHAREKLGTFGFAVERLNLQEQSIDVWISEVDYTEEFKYYPALRILLHISSPDYKTWRDPLGSMYLWFKDFPEYVVYSQWTEYTYNYRWDAIQVFKVPVHCLERWRKITKSAFKDTRHIRGFINTAPVKNLISYGLYYDIVEIEEKSIVMKLCGRFYYHFGASISLL